MAADGAFGDLRRLADWFSAQAEPASSSGGRTTSIRSVEKVMRRLGTTAVPLLGRELQGADTRRREAARDALAWLATTPARPRVIDALKSVTAIAAMDEAKVCALGLLAELGERAEARFSDPHAMQRRTALALAVQLETPADVASAADLMVRQISHEEIAQIIDILVDSAPAAANRLGTELVARLDLPTELRDRIAARIALLPEPVAAATRRATRPSHVAVLVDAAARLVVIASRKHPGARRWRRWAVLVAATGRIEDCLHEDDAGDDADAGALIQRLCGDGYRVASSDHAHAQTVVMAAARLTGSELPASYYLGRDLLALGDTHLRTRPRRDPTLHALSRAIDRLATGDAPGALALLGACDPAHPDVAAARGACFVALGRHAEALAPLEIAIASEPGWPLHHWNQAVALHALGDAIGAHTALCRFVAASANPSGLYGDPEQPERVARAERMIAELERHARLVGTPLSRRRRRRTAKARR